MIQKQGGGLERNSNFHQLLLLHGKDDPAVLAIMQHECGSTRIIIFEMNFFYKSWLLVIYTKLLQAYVNQDISPWKLMKSRIPLTRNNWLFNMG